MTGNRILTGIAVFAMAGVIGFSGCRTTETAAEGQAAVKSSAMTEPKSVKKAGGKAGITTMADDKTVEKKESGFVKTQKKASVSEEAKERNPGTGKKGKAVDGTGKKDSKKTFREDSRSVEDAASEPKKTKAAENSEVEPSNGDDFTSDSTYEDNTFPENTESPVPASPEVPVETPYEEMPEEPAAEIPAVMPETSAEAQPEESAHEHTWEEIMELVHHDAVYGEPPLIAPAEDITYDVTEMHNICGICGANLDEVGVEHDYMHLENGEGFWYYNDYIVVGQRTEHFDAEYGEPPLITPAYDEWVGTGRYRCIGCGETK